MRAEVIAALAATGASLGSAATAWFAQRSAARIAAGADRTGAVITAKTDISTNDKTIYVERITAERAIWRSDMREHSARLVALVHANTSPNDPELRYRSANIALRLNPAGFSDDVDKRDQHPLDRDLHAALSGVLAGEKKGPAAATHLERLVARLLKQVWEDSKAEARRTPLG